MKRQRVTALIHAIRIVVTMAPASLLGCNERFEFDVPPPDAGEATGDASGDGDVGSDVSTDTTTSTTGAAPDAGPGSACTADSDCRIASLYCHPTLGRCVECFDDQDCSTADATHCDAELFRCVSCTQDAHCAEGSRCDGVERRCAQSCATTQDCVDAHACKNGLCVACDRDVECRESDASRPVCSASGLDCVSCREDAQCPQLEFCDVLSGRCVACLSSADCNDDTVCNPLLLECVAG